MKIYNKDYVKNWIENDESGKDIFRVKYLEPYLKRVISNLPDNEKILDIGCGWGKVIEFIKDTHEYVGIEIAKEFFDYIRHKYKNKNINLVEGHLPNKIVVKNSNFDLVICSMVLHVLPEIKNSLKTIFSKAKEKGEVIIIDFNDKAEKDLRKTFTKIVDETKNSIKGIVELPSGVKVNSEVYFHKERDFEEEFKKYGRFSKEYLGPLFVAYKIENEISKI